MRTVVSLLRERVTDPPTLGELARATGVGPYALLRAFRAETGLPPHAYLNQAPGSARPGGCWTAAYRLPRLPP